MQRGELTAGFFLLAHDEFSGQLKISADLLRCGLVGAQFGDLVLARQLQMVAGRVAASDLRGNGADAIAAWVVGSIAQQQETHVVRTWTENLGEPLQELVARRLMEQGVVRRESRGGPFRRNSADRFPAVDLLRAAGPKVRLQHLLRAPREMDLAGGFAAALVFAVGVERAVLDPDLDRDAARQLVAEVQTNLPPDLREILDGVGMAVAAVSLRVRR